MIYEQVLCEKKIQDIEFKLTLCLYLKISKLEINEEEVWIQDVDVAQIIRAIMTSTTVYEFKKGIDNVWNEFDITDVLASVVCEIQGVN